MASDVRVSFIHITKYAPNSPDVDNKRDKNVVKVMMIIFLFSPSPPITLQHLYIITYLNWFDLVSL